MYNKFMKGTILLYGGSRAARDKKIEDIIFQTETKLENNPDVLFIVPEPDKKTIGIEQTRGLIKYITQKPFSSHYKYVIIPEAYKITPPAQNSLLKTLEEPPAYATIILSTNTQRSLLPTVLSRCQKVEVKGYTGSEAGRGSSVSFSDIVDMEPGERLVWTEETAKEERETVTEILEDFIVEERDNLKTSPDAAFNIELLTDVKQNLEKTNVNLKLSLEFLSLHIK